MLPCLATAAALEFKITGSDKGIWWSRRAFRRAGRLGWRWAIFTVSAPLQGLLDWKPRLGHPNL